MIKKTQKINTNHGYDWEEAFFGISSLNIKCESAYKDLHSAIDAITHLQAVYSWNPKNPHKSAAKKLYQKVMERLNPEDGKDLELFCTLGSTFDYDYGADGFFRVRGAILLFDLTVNKRKINNKKSFIFQKSDSSSFRINIVAARIARRLRIAIRRSDKKKGKITIG